MARLVSIIIGVVVLSMMITFMLKLGAEIGTSTSSDTHNQLSTLSDNYQNNIDQSRNGTSVLGRLRNVTSGSIVEQGLFFVDSGITGGKILLDSVDNTNEIVNMVDEDTGILGEGNTFLKYGIITIIGLIFTVSILYFFWRGKAET